MMDAKEFIEKYPFLKQNLLPIALGFLGLIFLGYGLIGLISSSNSSKDILFEAKEATGEGAKTINITVDIEGSVVKPGVYHLPIESRIQEAISAAGGLSASADREFIARTINLATKLSDGAKIYIPRVGETETEGIKSIKGVNAEDKININTGSEEMLDSLPGIGPATSQKIISGRPYSSIDELLDKKIVGSKVFSQIKEKISVY